MPNLITRAELAAADAAFADLTRTRLDAIIEAASRKVEAHCRRGFALDTYTEYHDAAYGPRLYLRNRPVVSITSVTVDGTEVDNTNLDAWTLDGASGVLTRGSGRGAAQFAAGWGAGTRNVVVVLVGGYSPIPADVREATIAECRYLLDTARASGVFQQEKIGDYFYSMNQYSTSSSRGGVGSAGAASLLAPYVQDDII
jgi:hypothetical protein